MSYRDTKTKRIDTVKISDGKLSAYEHNKKNVEQHTSGKNEIARVMKALTLLKEVSSQRRDEVSLRLVDAMRSTMEKLAERMVQSQLPLAAIHKTLHEVRLDALLLATQLKVQAMYDHQILIAPRPEWREQIRADHPELNDWFDLEKDTPQNVNELLQGQLNIIESASDILFEFNGAK